MGLNHLKLSQINTYLMKNNIELTEQSELFYHYFNSFILSDDCRIFNKMMARAFLYNEVKDIPGDIVECGVFKGSGVYTFLKLKRILNPNTSKKVVGFDFFNTNDLLSTIKFEDDKNMMMELFNSRNFSHDGNYKNELHNRIIENGFNENEFMLIGGDISVTSREFQMANPGFKISLLYMDLDLEEPTYETLNNLWDNVTKGGIIVFDEYGYHPWSESKGVDKFIQEKNLTLLSLNYQCPTAYIKK
jgi:hypothetical protein